MYPRNAASPEPIAIGAVVQISDGAVQTSGVTVRIKPVGVAEGNGAGITAYSTDGVVLYTPTQAETNYTSFVLIASKSGCIPASQTVITSESTTAGRVYVQTNGDKTGYSLSSAGVSGVTDGVWNALLSSYTTNGSFGARLIRSTNSNNEVSLTGGPTPHIAASIHNAEPNSIPAGALAAAAIAEIQTGLGTVDNQRYLLSILAGATSNAGTAGETYVITIGGSTYTVTYAGLDATGNRGTTAFAKT